MSFIPNPNIIYVGLAACLMTEATAKGLQNFDMNEALYNLVFAEKYPSDIGITQYINHT